MMLSMMTMWQLDVHYVEYDNDENDDDFKDVDNDV